MNCRRTARPLVLVVVASLAWAPMAAAAGAVHGAAAAAPADAERGGIPDGTLRASGRRGDGAVHVDLDPESSTGTALGAADGSGRARRLVGSPPQQALSLDGCGGRRSLDGSPRR